MKLCKRKHQNSPNAKICWVCGQIFEEPKPIFIQKTNTTVPSNLPDVNKVVPGECDKYVGKRERCDDKDPTGYACTFIPNCVVRLDRFKKKPALDVAN